MNLNEKEVMESMKVLEDLYAERDPSAVMFACLWMAGTMSAFHWKLSIEEFLHKSSRIIHAANVMAKEEATKH
jgi:hypothetical protein